MDPFDILTTYAASAQSLCLFLQEILGEKRIPTGSNEGNNALAIKEIEKYGQMTRWS